MNPAAEFAARSVRCRPANRPPSPGRSEPEIDSDFPVEIDDDAWDAFLPDDDYEPLPEYGDFWTEQDAA